MRVAIIGSGSSIDNELCLIRALQKKGVDFRYYFCVNNQSTPLFRITKNYPHEIIRGTDVEELSVFKYYVNLDNIYMLGGIGLRFRNPRLWWLYIKLCSELLRYKPSVIHYTWPQTRTPAITYMLKGKKVMTVHDPIPHSSHDDMVVERYRRFGFKRADRLVLLNTLMTDDFCKYYKVDSQKIRYSKLGVFDYLDHYPATKMDIDGKYILFFGQIASYKGLEYLLPAMVKVHEKHPDWKLVVAGGGKMYFDITPYETTDYILIRNHFIEMPELVGLLRGCEFAVAPYKDATQSGLLLNVFSVGKPMIVTNVGNLPEMVDGGKMGIVVPPCNIEALAAAMNEMIENQGKRVAMSEEIKSEWRRKFNWEEIRDGIIDIYQN